jgi:carboxylesterase type B
MNPTADVDHMSEDCLYLNVFVPAGQATLRQKLPVLVWLHGGAFQQGGARRPEYDGRRLAERGTVVVTLNYRLGALGFLVSSVDGLFGNFGLMDQRAALSWVQDNIANFGGDPTNVLLFGESAGAVMTGLHLMMEKEGDDPAHSQRLFHKAIIQSNPLGLQFRSVVVADFIGDALKSSVDCRDLACLRAERVEEILRAQSTLMGVPRSVGDFFTWGPTLTDSWKVSLGGGDTRTSSTATNPSAFSPLSREHVMFRDLDSWKWQRRRGDTSVWAHVNVTQPFKDFGRIPDDIPVIIGANKNEGEMFVHGAFPIAMSKPVYWMFVGALFRDSASKVLKHYRGFVDQLEAEAAATARVQIEEEENRQYYLEHQEALDSEYEMLMEMNSTRVKGSSVQSLVETWSRGGATFDDEPMEDADESANGSPGQQQSFWKRMLPFGSNTTMEMTEAFWNRMQPFSSNLTKEERDALRIQERSTNRRLKEEKRQARAKARALREAAKVVVDYRPVMSRIIDDYLFRCPAWHLAQSLSRDRVERGRNNNVYVYQFSHSTHIPGYKECWGKSCHTSEIPYAFQAMDIIRTNYSTLGMYAQREAPSSPEYPYTDMMNAYRGALEAADRMVASEETVTPVWGNEGFNLTQTKAFKKILAHFFGDYFEEDADEEIASDMADRWVAFARTGDPNYDGAPAAWRPWRYQLEAGVGHSRGRPWRPADFDLIFDDEEIGNVDNETLIDGFTWSDDPQVRLYRKRALAALGMEVVEEDVFRTILRRSKKTEDVESFFESIFFANKNNQGKSKDSKRTRQVIRRLQQIAQDMGVIGRGLMKEPRRGQSKGWEEDFFPEILELKWPPEGRLVERDCTCDLWDKIRYRY